MTYGGPPWGSRRHPGRAESVGSDVASGKAEQLIRELCSPELPCTHACLPGIVFNGEDGHHLLRSPAPPFSTRVHLCPSVLDVMGEHKVCQTPPGTPPPPPVGVPGAFPHASDPGYRHPLVSESLFTRQTVQPYKGTSTVIDRVYALCRLSSWACIWLSWVFRSRWRSTKAGDCSGEPNKRT
jgi:hypothetical protein